MVGGRLGPAAVIQDRLFHRLLVAAVVSLWRPHTAGMHPHLQFVAERRLGVFTARDARRAGYSPDEISAAVRSNQWRVLRRGVYIETGRWAAAAGDGRAQHLIACAAVLVSLAE